MPQYEYKVVPAPAKGLKAPGVKTPEARFANSVESLLNRLGAEGWEYLRAELLPSEERSGLTGSATNWRNVLVFRRLVASNVEQFQPRLLEEAPDQAAPAARIEPVVSSGPDTKTTGIGEGDAQAEPDTQTDPEDRPETADARDLVLQFSKSVDRKRDRSEEEDRRVEDADDTDPKA